MNQAYELAKIGAFSRFLFSAPGAVDCGAMEQSVLVAQASPQGK